MAKKLKIVEMGLHELSPYANNPRKNKKAVDAVAASIAEFGFKVPIVADSSGEIIAGHTRYKAAKKLGLETVPVIIADDLSEDQIKAFRLADNKVGELAEWDLDKLVAELEGIELDMEQFGFEDLDLDKEPIEEDFYEPEPPDEPKAKPGQIWMLGKHRLMCGDSTSERDISKLMSGAQADLVITDPPYNVNYEGSAKELKHKKIENDSMADSCFHDFLLDFYNLMLLYLKAGGVFYIWHADSEGANFRGALKEAGAQVRECLVWNKSSFVLGRQDYHWKHEPCLYGWKDGAAHYFCKDRTQSTVLDDPELDISKMSKKELQNALSAILSDDVPKTVIDEPKPQANDKHPTMKPVKLIGRLMKNSSRKGWIVADFFGGSGTTLIAAEQLGRRCYMMEYDPAFVDVIIDRWQELTGEEAVLLE